MKIMRITMKRVKSSLPEYKKIKRLYLTAFPPEERPSFFTVMSRAYREDVDFWGVYADGRWVGLAYVISMGDLSYLFYLAVSETQRGKGCGSAIMRTLKRMYEGQRLFLALEQLDESADNYEERVRRRQFYLKNGLKPINCRIREGSVTYDVMGTSDSPEPWEYRKMMREYLGKVMSFFYKFDAFSTKD